MENYPRPNSVTSIAELYKCETESFCSSVPSKQQIDKLFNDSRSVASDYLNPEPEGGIDSLTSPEPKNDVQVRIEKMFSDVSKSSEPVANRANCNVATPSANKFHVVHLNSMPLRGKITSVGGLQGPLKHLFLQHCKNSRLNQKPSMGGSIHLSDHGLMIEYCNKFGGTVEKLNSFSNIAIWASLRFSKRRCLDDPVHYECAFMPIVANSSDKDFLYERIDDDEMVASLDDLDNVPLFVVVVREADYSSSNRQLLCHAFICDSNEDAVVIAATLYRVLMTKLGRNRVLKDKSQVQMRKPARSVASSKLCSIEETSNNGSGEFGGYSEVRKPPRMMHPPPPPPPLPPPSLPPPPPMRPPRKNKDYGSVLKRTPGESLESPSSPSKSKEKNAENGGDVFTKVAFPRSSSFLNLSHLGTETTTNGRTALELTRVHPKGSPLGFMEMFNELQSQEGLETVDQILNVIIKEEGMSFNDLKPIYKEFLLKLAVVLSKDELYNRSKVIMKSQKRMKSCRMKTVISSAASAKKASVLKNVLKKPLTKLKASKVITSRDSSPQCSCNAISTPSKLICSDGTSTDSFLMTDPSKSPIDGATKHGNRHKSFKFRSSSRVISTSEDSDYPHIARAPRFSRGSKSKDEALNPSSSGYFSFSECSYDTESCTCRSADKCYCSMKKPTNRNKKSSSNSNASLTGTPTTPAKNYTATMCSCDTLDCRKRNKCYCTSKDVETPPSFEESFRSSSKRASKMSLMEQLKQKGFAVSDSSLSADENFPPSPVPLTKITSTTTKERNTTKSSKSLEYLESNSAQFKNRMDIYSGAQKVASCRHSYVYSNTQSPSHHSSSAASSSKGSRKKSSSSDNLAGVDYSLFDKKRYAHGVGESHHKGRFLACSPKHPNLLYAQMACPQINAAAILGARDYPPHYHSQFISTPRTDGGSLISLYPHQQSHRTCSCTCSCPMFTGEAPSFHSGSTGGFGVTPFHRMNMENIFGYYP